VGGLIWWTAGSVLTNESQRELRELLTTVRKFHYLTPASPTADGRLKPNPTGTLQRGVLPDDRVSPHTAKPSYLTSQKPGDGHGA